VLAEVVPLERHRSVVVAAVVVERIHSPLHP